MSDQITESQFYMWRTIFALAHADDIVTSEELRFMAEALEDIPFSATQKAALELDAREEQSVEAMFKQISDPVDQAEFFRFASKLAHIDGDFGVEEQEVMLRLTRIHLENVDVDALIGKINLSFDDDGDAVGKTPSFKSAVTSYRQRFLKALMGKKD